MSTPAVFRVRGREFARGLGEVLPEALRADPDRAGIHAVYGRGVELAPTQRGVPPAPGPERDSLGVIGVDLLRPRDQGVDVDVPSRCAASGSLDHAGPSEHPGRVLDPRLPAGDRCPRAETASHSDRSRCPLWWRMVSVTR